MSPYRSVHKVPYERLKYQNPFISVKIKQTFIHICIYIHVTIHLFNIYGMKICIFTYTLH